MYGTEILIHFIFLYFDGFPKRQHYDANKRKEAAEYSWVLSGSPPPPHVRAAYKTFKKPQGF